MDSTKTCTRCKEVKPLTHFSKHAGSRDGLQHRCKICAVEITAEWQRLNPEKVAARNKRWKDKNLDRVYKVGTIYARRWKEKNPEATKARQRVNSLKRMGLTPDEYDAIWESQGKGCGICGSPIPEGHRLFAIDHNHGCCPPRKACKECIRGLLCPPCNTALHKLENDGEWNRKALAYLERFKVKSDGRAESGTTAR